MGDMASSNRPVAGRSITEPSPSTMLQNYFNNNTPSRAAHAASSRTRSPFSRSHKRSHSSGSALTLPPMIRAHSVPAVPSAMRAYEHDGSSTPSSGSRSPNLSASHSPQRSPARRSPLTVESLDTSYFPPRSPRWFELSNGAPIESIQEDSELDLTPRNSSFGPPLAPPATNSMRSASSSMRRRPASPLYSASSSPATAPTSYPASADSAGSPLLAPAAKFNDTVPTPLSLHHYASNSSFSSISTTPSSARSRSPSISSLDTIEDEPDAESEALEADRLWKLSLSDKERNDDVSDDSYKRRGFGYGRGRNTERKRWSVCGGERRADLDLETIWED